MPLGRGLGALIPTGSGQVPQETVKKITKETLQQTGEQVLNIPIEQIEPNPAQPRKLFDHREMEELINSVRQYGIIQPLIVTPSTGSGQAKIGESKYQIVAGERRWRAAKFLELKTVPAIVRSVNENEKLELSLVENIQRKDLNPMERARAYQRLIDEFNLIQEEVAKRIGKARATVANTLRLLNLPLEIQQAIEEEKITEGHAKALLSLDDPEKQKSFLRRILGVGLTVRETEKQVAGHRIRVTTFDPVLEGKERKLAEILGTKVKIEKKKNRGKIVIEFYSQEELDDLVNKLSSL